MMQRLRAWAALLALLCIAPAVHAHANLVDSVPRDGAVMERAPSEIALRFDEPVTPLVLKVLDATGRDVAAGGALQSRDGEVRMALPGLPAGGYVVTWRVVSADAHPIAGAQVFIVGAAAGGTVSTPVTGADDPWIVPVVVARLLLYLTLLPAAGAMLFHLLVGAPLKVHLPAASGLVVVMAGVALAAALLGLGIKGAQVLAASPRSLLDAQTWRVAAATSTGLSLLVVAGGVAALLAFLSIGPLRRAGAWPPTVAAVVALAGLASPGTARRDPRGCRR
jgi:copper transport protein